MMLRNAGWLTLGSIGAVAAYLRLIRPWQLRWGATDAEVERSMPGDDDVPRPTFNATRAVSVAARPEQIWPWLMQIGVVGRDGWYSYDWLRQPGPPQRGGINPEFQHVAGQQHSPPHIGIVPDARTDPRTFVELDSVPQGRASRQGARDVRT